MKRIYMETLGCAKNRVDSEIMLAALRDGGYGYTDDPAQAEVIIVNTCAFLTAASEESIERLLALSDHKSASVCEKLVCAGCLSERYREQLLEDVPEIDGLLGSSNFHEIPELVDALYQPAPAGGDGGSAAPNRQVRLLPRPHYAHYEQQEAEAQGAAPASPRAPGLRSGKAFPERLQTTPAPYAYVKVAEGCSNMCSFCNIPSLRGYFSSRSIASVVEEVRAGVERGVLEFNLISQDTSSYGVDRNDGADLAHLLRAVDQVDGDYWLRLFYAYPNTFGPDAIAAVADSEHVLPYLDMPFQHITDRVLRAMNRRITEAQVRHKLAELRDALPQLTLRTTFIVGFPSETDGDFARLLAFVEEGWFDHVGVFAYSHEDNIKSAKLGDPVPNRIKRERRKLLMAAQQAVATRRNEARVGSHLRVLVEGPSEETELLLSARAAFQGPEVDGVTYINEGEVTAPGFQTVEITEAHVYDLVGKIMDSSGA